MIPNNDLFFDSLNLELTDEAVDRIMKAYKDYKEKEDKDLFFQMFPFEFFKYDHSISKSITEEDMDLMLKEWTNKKELEEVSKEFSLNQH